MRWQGRRQSGNVEDRRGIGGRGLAVGGGLGGVVLIILYLLLGGNPSDIGSGLQIDQPATTGAGETALSAHDQEMGQFVSTVLASIEDVWRARFQEMGRTYVEPKVVLFSGQVGSACGYAGASAGPFYCPGDSKVYFDLAFFEDMQRQLGAQGRFCPGLCHRSRGRPSRPEPARHQRAGPVGAAPPERGGIQQALGRPGAPGRLPGRALGPLCQPRPGLPRGRRHRRGDERGQRRRRRPDHEAVAGLRRARRLHPRHIRTAPALVPQGARHGRHPSRRYLRRRQSVAKGTGAAGAACPRGPPGHHMSISPVFSLRKSTCLGSRHIVCLPQSFIDSPFGCQERLVPGNASPVFSCFVS